MRTAGGSLCTFGESISWPKHRYICMMVQYNLELVPNNFSPDIDNITDNSAYMIFCTIYILVGLAFTSTTIELVRSTSPIHHITFAFTKKLSKDLLFLCKDISLKHFVNYLLLG